MKKIPSVSSRLAANDAYTFLAEELRQVFFEACAEISVLEVMDRSLEASCLDAVCCHTGTLGAEM